MKPLEGIRILDLTHFLSGPYSTMLLGGLGAEIIKIEHPINPDSARSVPPHFIEDQALYYLSLNANKKSLTLDLKAETGREIFLRLVEKADVVFDNFRPGVMERLGLDGNVLRKRNPRIITCSLSGFGKNGPYKNLPGYDYLIQALAGTMSLTGDPDGPPTKFGVSIVDHVGGLFAMLGILTSLLKRSQTGEGADVDVSLLDTHVSMLSYIAANYLNAGAVPQRFRNSAHPSLVPSQLFKASDGYFVIMPLAEHFWPPLCQAIGFHNLVDDPRFRTAADRLRNRDELVGILDNVFRKRTVERWVHLLREVDVPVAPVQSVEDALNDPQIAARQMVVETEHSEYGRIKILGNPLKITGLDEDKVSAAPTLGQHTHEILSGTLGFTESQIKDLKGRGIC